MGRLPHTSVADDHWVFTRPSGVAAQRPLSPKLPPPKASWLCPLLWLRDPGRGGEGRAHLPPLENQVGLYPSAGGGSSTACRSWARRGPVTRRCPQAQEELTDGAGHGEARAAGERLRGGDRRPRGSAQGGMGLHTRTLLHLLCSWAAARGDCGGRGEHQPQGTLLPPAPTVRPSAGQPQTGGPSWEEASVLCKGLGTPGGAWTSHQETRREHGHGTGGRGEPGNVRLSTLSRSAKKASTSLNHFDRDSDLQAARKAARCRPWGHVPGTTLCASHIPGWFPCWKIHSNANATY